MEVHRCRFVEFTPNTIVSVALSFDNKELAVGRSSGSIEIWSLANNWLVTKVISGGQNQSVDSLAWNKEGRLFSGAQNATIIEWDLVKLCPKTMADSFGGPVWCISISEDGKTLAAGCEDGCVRLYDISQPDQINYIKALVSDKKRILSISWQPNSGKILVSGSADGNIRKWNITTGRSSNRIQVESQKGGPTLIWAIAALKDGTIVSGDSLGHVQFWDGEMGTLIETFSSHSADVLCVLATRNGDSIYATGIDNKVVQINYLKEKGKWIVGESKRVHTHDVRSACISHDDKFLITGGVDTNLVCYELPTLKSPLGEVPSFPHRPIITNSKSKKLLCCQFPSKVEIWSLGKVEGNTNMDNFQNFESLSISLPEQKILEMKFKTDNHIVDSCLSENGEFLVISTAIETKLFALKTSGAKIAVEKLASSHIKPAHKLLFTSDSQKLVVASNDSYIHVYDLTTPDIKLISSFSQHISNESNKQNGTITNLATSKNGRWLASGDTNNWIHIYDLEKKSHFSTLPLNTSQHTSFCFNPDSTVLAVSYASNVVLLFDVENRRLTNWSRDNSGSLPKKLLKQKNRIISMCFHASKPNIILLQGLTYFALIDTSVNFKQVQMQLKKSNKKKVKKDEKEKEKEDNEKIEKEEEKEEKEENKQNLELDQDQDQEMTESKPNSSNSNTTSKNFQMFFRYGPILHIDFISSTQMVVVERPWIGILQKLPPSLYRPRYGT